ncbi:MAG: 3-isopropylmalate dehydrogenase, partial [Kordiimonadaceae bacterium]|nr:3-isopropylmalate dehydrogenase [Kordiimonadaceae bacterium]
MTTHSIMLLPGDGIGPEVMAQARRVMTWVEGAYDVTFEISEGLIGGCAYDAEGSPLTDETLAKA